jgi:hypothetical protein
MYLVANTVPFSLGQSRDAFPLNPYKLFKTAFEFDLPNSLKQLGGAVPLFSLLSSADKESEEIIEGKATMSSL